eukprot:TRINITY_DN7394_c0_g2_i1.p1 TRINITY_DN7394_c0_g2~~TRINITY_DN7394_c0_g2_i1.p1  ORF type:complete len:322 (-),score=66.36 TRINITY_DN7394_c0_g2_i1:629-1570(-)
MSSEKKSVKDRFPLQFSDDKVLHQSVVFQVFYFLSWTVMRWIHDITVRGAENLPPVGEGALIISYHTQHNADILVAMAAIYAATKGRVARGLLHSMLYDALGFLVQWIGLVPGTRDSAVELLKSGFIVGVLPGGSDEAMVGGDGRYKLYEPAWSKRRGYVEVAKAANVKIYPSLVRNGEEMRFNPLFYLWSQSGLSAIYYHIITPYEHSNEPESIKAKDWRKHLKVLGSVFWYLASWFSIVVPCKLEFVIGQPVQCDYSTDSSEEIAAKCKNAMEKLLSENQPLRKVDYFAAVRERIIEFNRFYEVRIAKKNH